MTNITQQPDRQIRIAAVQICSSCGSVANNLNHATQFIKQAVEKQAQFIILPELYATGYDGTRNIWDLAEPLDGPIAQWVESTARRFGIYLGCGMPERYGDDCFNAFLLVGPDGNQLGVARKSNAEGYVFCRGKSIHVIESPIGRIGVGICADNQQATLVRLMAKEEVDLVLMPHAAPMLAGSSRFEAEADIKAQHERVKTLPVLYAKALGVPVVYANQVGPFGKVTGILGGLMARMGFELLGLSRIVDSNGQVVAELGSEEGLAIADIVLAPDRKRFTPPKEYAGMLFPTPAFIQRVIMPIDIILGRTSYWLKTQERRQRFMQWDQSHEQ